LGDLFHSICGFVLGSEGHDPVFLIITVQAYNLGRRLYLTDAIANILLRYIRGDVAQDELAHRGVWISFRYRHFTHLRERESKRVRERVRASTSETRETRGKREREREQEKRERETEREREREKREERRERR
jgi:hypothetical protein